MKGKKGGEGLSELRWNNRWVNSYLLFIISYLLSEKLYLKS